MSKNGWDGLVHWTETFLRENMPGILMGLGIFGMVSTTALAVKNTPKAMQKIDAKKKELDADKLPLIQTIKAAGPCYIPAIMTGAISIGCLIGSANVSNRRNAALATAYQLSETAFRTYREKVIETIGERKEIAVREKAVQERMDKAEPKTNLVLIAGNGQTLCFDMFSEREFLSDWETIRKAQNDFTLRLRSEMYLSYNEWLDMLGLPPHPVGNDLGWNVNSPPDITPVATLRHGTPCIALDYSYSPPDYRYRM